MIELRLAKNNEKDQLKNIWKLCFGDPDNYIDLYYAKRYRAAETALLLYNGEIASMLTMLLAKAISPGGERLDAAVLYAIATHPKYRGRGYGSRLIDFSNELLKKKNIKLSILVPAGKSLYDFYGRLGYKTGFYISEAVHTAAELLSGTGPSQRGRLLIKPANAPDYNRRRDILLRGEPYLSYYDEDIAYQKEISIRSGADIYTLDSDQVQGCAVAERFNSEEIIIKEMLLPPGCIKAGIVELARLLPAKEYILRMPAFLGKDYGGKTRPFAMCKLLSPCQSLISLGRESNYLGLAFD